MAAGCKPAAPCELRGFESSPVHQEDSDKWRVPSDEQVKRQFAFKLVTRHCCRGGGSNSVVESQPSKLLVAGSIPVSRSNSKSAERTSSFDLQISGFEPGPM